MLCKETVDPIYTFFASGGKSIWRLQSLSGTAQPSRLSGAVAAIGMGRATRCWPGIEALARRAPYLSVALMLALAAYVGSHAWLQLSAVGTP